MPECEGSVGAPMDLWVSTSIKILCRSPDYPNDGKVSPMLRRARDVFRDNKGIAPLEYALIAGLIFSALLNASLALSPKLSKAFTNIGNSLDSRVKGT